MAKAKRQRVLSALLVLLFCGASWGLTVYGHRQELSGLDVLRKNADEKFEKQIYDEALTSYKACLRAAPEDVEIMGRIAQIYHFTGQDNNCIAWCERVLRATPENLELRILEARSYDNKKNVSSAIRVLQRAGKTDGTDAQREERETFLRELKGRYDLAYFTFQWVAPWFSLPDGTPCATVADEQGFSIYSAAGKQQVSGNYAYLGACSDGELLFPVREGDACFFVDENSERRLVPDGTYTSLRGFSSGLAPAARKSGTDANAAVVAGYLDQTLVEKRFEFTETYPLVDGLALAKKDGTYFVLDDSLQETTACEFVDVKRDVYGFAQKYGRIVGRFPGEQAGWALFTADGTRVGDFSAEDIRMPEAKDAPIAYCKGGLWGFVSADGEVLLEPAYEDAKSFSKGYAPVKVDGKWGYIDKSGALLIPQTFDDAGPMSRTGTAFVKNHAGYSLLTLSRYTR